MSNDGRKFIAAIHDLYEANSDVSDTLPFFHAFTGNHPTTSAFNGIGKKTAMNTWKKFDGLESAVQDLMGNNYIKWNEKSINVLEQFVMMMYDSKTKHATLGDCRRVLFSVKGRPIDKIPPTRDALEQHVKRALLQASIWTQCLGGNNKTFEHTDWGWTIENEGKFLPKWTTIPILADHCQELISCSCKGKCNRCKCALKKLPCTKLCLCKCVGAVHTNSIPAENRHELISCSCKGKCNRCKCVQKKIPCNDRCKCKCDMEKNVQSI